MSKKQILPKATKGLLDKILKINVFLLLSRITTDTARQTNNEFNPGIGVFFENRIIDNKITAKQV